MELFGGTQVKPVTLAYGDLAEARKQRRSLMQAGNIAAVPSDRLVNAIQIALGQKTAKSSKTKEAVL